MQNEGLTQTNIIHQFLKAISHARFFSFSRTIRLTVNDLDGKNHELYISKLFEDIQPSESFFKVKLEVGYLYQSVYQ